MLFPYLAFMTRDFHLTDNDKELGYYAGYIASAFSVGQLTSRCVLPCLSSVYMWPIWALCAPGLFAVRLIPLISLTLNISCSFFWGWISDRKGRRPILLVGLIGTFVSVLMFGFAVNFPMALAARFTAGLLNGACPCLFF